MLLVSLQVWGMESGTQQSSLTSSDLHAATAQDQSGHDTYAGEARHVAANWRGEAA